MPFITTWFDSLDEFEDVLDAAEANAKTPWEQDFVADWRTRYKNFGRVCFMTERQANTLQNIADGVSNRRRE